MGAEREVWAVGDAYEAYIGRWSRLVAEPFVRWLNARGGLRWLDVGCGTGALTGAVLGLAEPAQITGLDPSAAFLELADARAALVVGDAGELPFPDRGFDVVVSGLALNFMPDPRGAVAEFVRVVERGGLVAVYVWDYADGMEMLRYFWDAVVTLEPGAAELDEGRRFPGCRPEALGRLWSEAGLGEVEVEAIEVPTVFADFEDFWEPFLGGQGPAPGYVMSLGEEGRSALRELVRARLPRGADGSISLTARAWAVRGVDRSGMEKRRPVGRA